ncbi:APC family permease [Thermogemmatispora carboxidivorans]|uniref:APC family permease n=1 Tax=Thermogemmatispora carboxidivorans TaxID=1382306 RepID=UPI00069BFA63|nr:APC family permease [Thermogemmatispora carboxidivorans]
MLGNQSARAPLASAEADTHTTPTATQESVGPGLRRAVGIWGSYTWGYADVGADVYVALGIVMAAAQGATNVAFLFAGLVYVMVGLAYTELAAAYPMAGGGQFYVLRGLGDFWGFVAGWAVLLDFTIDISLFALASAGYINFFVPVLNTRVDLHLGGLTLPGVQPWLILEATIFVVLLTILNIIGVRESSRFNELLGALDVISESTILFFGFLFAFDPQLLLRQMTQSWPNPYHLAYGASLAIISFVGLESISQASQETIRPGKVVPRTSLALILTVLIYALAFSNLGLAMLPWQSFAEHNGDPIAWLASHIPFLGLVAGPYVALLGATLVLISSNAGVFGSSRITYSMARYDLLPRQLARVHPKFRTPVRTLVIFSGFALLELWLAGLSPNAYDVLGNMYAFGAATAYILVFISLLVLRFVDPWTPRPFKVPLNIRFRGKDGESRLLPVVGILGLLGISSMLVMVVLTHAIGRLAGPGWLLLGLLVYVWHRKRSGLPIFGSVPRDWPAEQLAVYADAEEYDLVEELRENLARQRHLAGEEPRAPLAAPPTRVVSIPLSPQESRSNGRRTTTMAREEEQRREG